jgi:uncharacterized protein (TIGR00290 family)
MALHEIGTNQRYRGYRVASLLTTLTEDYDRISGHGVRRSVLEYQAACLGLELRETYISKGATLNEYESVMEAALLKQKRDGTHVVASGDIFVEKRRMAMCKKMGMKACFPLMLRDTRDHIRAFIDLGFKAYVVCVDAGILDASFAGRTVDEDFLDQLPTGVDPCGENGEFHTFVFDGPGFRQPVECRPSEVVLREMFYFCDVVLDNGSEVERTRE